MTTSQDSLPKHLNQDQMMTQECKNLLSSLPVEEGWEDSTLYKYQGFWYPSMNLQGVLSCQKHFQAQDTDILLATPPKAGTTWLKAILFALMNRTRFPQPRDNHPLLSNNPHALVPSFEFDLYLKSENPDLSSITSPRIFSTHMPYVSLPKSVHDSQTKIVYVCRNPKDVFVSLWTFTNKLRLEKAGTNPLDREKEFEKFYRGVSPFGPLWDHVLGYWEESLKDPKNVFFLTYEEMKEQPKLHLMKLADFVGCPFSSEEEEEGMVDDILEICSFENLSNLKVNKEGKFPSGINNNSFFRKGQVGDWKNHLTEEMVERLDKICQEKFEGTGLKF